MSKIQQFYSKIQFPGLYTVDNLNYHIPHVKNPYLQLVECSLGPDLRVLDVGCGTGLISNLFAQKYPSSEFVGVDFADSIDHAKKITDELDLANTTFVKKDFLNFTDTQKYDLIICQGVLHHIPDADIAANKIRSLLRPTGSIVLGLYHPWGKFLKKWVNIDYKNAILYQDQEQNPYETAYTPKQVLSLFPGFRISHAYPGNHINIGTSIRALLNYRNGGLITYVLKEST